MTYMDVYVDRRTSNMSVNQHVELTVLHTYYEFITRLRNDFAETQVPAVVSTTDQKMPRKRLARWPCEFGTEDYELRLFKFKTMQLPGLDRIEPHEIEKYVVVIDGARRHWSWDLSADVCNVLGVKTGVKGPELPRVVLSGLRSRKAILDFAPLRQTSSRRPRTSWSRPIISGSS